MGIFPKDKVLDKCASTPWYFSRLALAVGEGFGVVAPGPSGKPGTKSPALTGCWKSSPKQNIAVTLVYNGLFEI